MPILDTCIITASDERQAEVFRKLLQRRRERGLYPREIDFRVYSDPRAGRAGSGGGTIWALLNLLRDEGLDLNGNRGKSGLEEADSRLSSRRILMIHAGGESRRLPCYVPEGKIFAPVPAPSSSFLPPVVLDMELSLFLKYPWRNGEILVTSGDALVDFNTDLLNLPDGPLCGFSAPESFETGSRHGVFAFDPITGAVRDYHQKASAKFLAQEARIEGTESCAVDIGIVSFRGQALRCLLASALEPLAEGSIAERVEKGQLPLDMYLELLTACLGSLDKESYRSRLAERSAAPAEILDLLFESFHPCGLSGALVRQASFIHFGSAEEFPAACRELRQKGLLPFYSLPHEELVPEAGPSLVRFDCLDAQIEPGAGGVYAEDCRTVNIRCEGENLLVGLRDLVIQNPVPRGFAIDERRLEDHGMPVTIRLVYHRNDSFKPQKNHDRVIFCNKPLSEWLAERGLSIEDAFPKGTATDLYAAELFPAGARAQQLEGYWQPPGDMAEWKKWFLASRRYSLAEANACTDAVARDVGRCEVRSREIGRALESGGFFAIPASELAELVAGGLDATLLVRRCAATDEPLLKAYRSAALRAAGVNGIAAVDRVEVPFAPRAAGGHLRCAVKLDQIVWARSPVRLDLAGGWTDTPPYTNRYGGAVLNVAVDLNGQSPIQVFARRTSEPRLTLHSIDLGLTEIITDSSSLRRYWDPGSPFALPRAALVLLGLGAGEADGAPLQPLFEAAGGGLELTLLCAVPKGSGLGTSSILAGTILSAVERFYGLNALRDELFLQVLEMEQMLTTGGGWQDQIGGLVGGVKYIESRPALKPRPVVRQLDPWMFESAECTERMTLFYTGFTRLAKGILQDVVGWVNGMGRAYLFTHGRVRELARDGRDAIALRDLDRLSRVIAESFQENRLVHPSTTNDEIEGVIRETTPYTSGMKLLGAGGGGFALFVSPDVSSARHLRSLLSQEFENDRARLVDFSLNKKGLEVTVS
ncbi:MAG: L-fucokinase [Spirochaetia bacterium]|jgi:galactokinase/mevalonate kinase-like predicted kinase